MSFSSRSLLSLARSAIRLLARSGASAPPSTTTTRSRGQAQKKPAGNPAARSAAQKTARSAAQKTARPDKAPAKAPASSPSGYRGDYRGKVTPVYAPSPDGKPDPGEVVWAWVPYEDDPSQGKDRPVLLIGRNGSHLLALMMTTRDRNNAQESDPDYVDVGTGSWDARGRPSEVKLDRVLQLEPAAVRRQGAVLSPAAFERVAQRFMARR